MTGTISHISPVYAPYASGRVVDRLYPGSSQAVNYKSRFKSFREVYHDTINTQSPELLSKAGFQESQSLKDKIDVPATGYVVTVPQEQLRNLQPVPAETRQEKLFNAFNPEAKDLTGSLVNMYV